MITYLQYTNDYLLTKHPHNIVILADFVLPDSTEIGRKIV